MGQKINWIATGAVVAFVALLGTAYVWRSLQPWAYTANNPAYRLTVSVEADGRQYQASRVYAYACTRRVPGSGANIVVGVPCEVFGKALAVDLGRRGTLFVLLTGWDAGHQRFTGADSLAHSLLFAAEHGGQLSPRIMPAMIRFQNVDKPDTIQIVDPEHLDRQFGPGVALKSMTIASVEAPYDEDGLDARLPWLPRLKGATLSQTPGTQANQLHGYDFEWPPQ